MRERETISWGIDLGTTNSSIAVFEGNNVKIIKNNVGDEVTPSAIFKKKVGDSIIKRVGKQAKNRLKEDRVHVAMEFKRCMGLTDWYFDFPSIGEKATAVDLSAEILKELITSVRQKESEEVYSALITVPAAFLTPAYEATKKAGEKAGISYVEVLEEPVAAALAYGLKAANKENAARWLVYDLGGGTFDAALVKIEEGVFSVFDHEGDRHLGGKNLDEAIVNRYFLPELPDTIKGKVVAGKSLSWWKLKFIAEEVKCQLSAEDSYTIDEMIEGHSFIYTFTKEQLSRLEKELFSSTIDKCRELLKRNGFSSKDIEKVVLVGGPTLSPHLRKMIEEELNIPIDFSVDPLTAVARGAAIYASGRRIPEDILNKIRKKNNQTKEVTLYVNLHYPTITTEEEIMITGTLESKNKKIKISSKWAIEINRIDKAGNVIRTSGKIPITENGAFAINIPVEDGENLFRLIVTDSQGKEIKTNKNIFSITRSIIKSDDTGLPRGIGVADNYGDMIWFFTKGTPLPTEKTIFLKTTKELKKGKKGDIINIPVLEGNEDKADLNRIIEELRVKGDRVPTTIPEGSSVEVTIEVNESRVISVNALFEAYDIEMDAIIRPDMDIDHEKLCKELETVQDWVKNLDKVRNYSIKIKQVLYGVERKEILKQIEKLVLQAKDNPEYAQQAMDKILELRKELYQILDEANELLKWKAHKEWCDKNIQMAKKIVREVGDLPSVWQDQFDRLLNEYEEAIKKMDYRESEEIAYIKLPDLFRRSEKLSERVGGVVSEIARERISQKGIKGDVEVR